MHSHICSSSIELKKLLVLNINGMFCYFPPLVVLERNVKVFGKNVNKTKVKVKVGMENFLNKTFQKFHIVIWYCMKLEDVLEVLPMLMPKSFLDWFIFFWGCEQCSKIYGEISLGSHYYLKDLKCVYYARCGKDYGKEDRTLLINDEPNKVFQNLKWTHLLNHSGDKCCQRIRCNHWIYHFICGHLWLDCHCTKWFKFIMTSKPCLSFLSKNYSWFLQYMYNDNVDVRNKQPFLSM